MNDPIDTNMWLSFYHYSAKDLEELSNRGTLIDDYSFSIIPTNYEPHGRHSLAVNGIRPGKS